MTPNPTPPSAEAMALHKDLSQGSHKETSLECIDRHFATLREKITGLQGLDIQNEEIITTLTDDRDALCKCVAGLEADRESLISVGAASASQMIDDALRITALQATVQALERDKKRLDWLERFGNERQMVVDSHSPGGLVTDWTFTVFGQGAGVIGQSVTLRAAIDAALATHSEGKKTS